MPLASCVEPTGPPASSARPTGRVTGTTIYLERIALPAPAMLIVTLEDVSRVDAPGIEVAATRVAAAGTPPIPFEIRYEPARIDATRVYAVAARIELGGRVLFASDRRLRVLTGGHPRDVEIIVRPVR
jgi:putative lipoprotein